MTTGDNHPPDRLVTDESRRSFLKKSTVATVGVGVAASGIASAQNDGEEDPGPFEEDENEEPGPFEGSWEALIFQNNFHPEARFTIISGVVDWNPNYGGIDESWFSNYNTRMIRWLNTGEHDQLFVSSDAEIGDYDENLGFVSDAEGTANQPQVYEVGPEWSPFEDDPKLVTINFSPVEEETEDQLLEGDNWWQNQQDATASDENASGNNTTRGK